MSSEPPSSAVPPAADPSQDTLRRSVLRRLRALAGSDGRVISGAAWSIGSYATSNVIRLISNLILTRLLAPDAFALVTIVASLQVMMNMISDLGIRTSIIKSERATDPAFLKTAFTLQIIRNAGIGTVLTVCAGIIALPSVRAMFPEGSVYTDPRLVHFLLLSALTMVLHGWISLKVPLLERDLQVRPVMMQDLGVQVATVAATVGFAMAGTGAYALILGTLAGGALRVLASHLLLPGPAVGIGLDRSAFSEIFHFGKWLALASFCHFLAARGDQLIAGAFLETVAFGHFGLAVVWISTAILAFDLLQGRVAMPALCEGYRDDPKSVTAIYYRMRLVMDAAAIVGFLGFLTFSSLFIGIVYEDRYAPVAGFMVLMAPRVLLAPAYLLRMVVLAAGDSRRFSTLTVVPGVALLIGTPILFTLMPPAWAIVFASCSPLFMLPLLYRITSEIIVLDWRREAVMPAVACLGVLWLLSPMGPSVG